ncbi:MAG TPA: hypothetical protein VMS00_14595 [Acidimicrobiales bacterium]|nr:hypothetical protein [Acidimicrobiales bacterium]
MRHQPGGQAGKAQSEDRFGRARAIAEAVLYEGYVLYPYRASSAKNQLRWQFGVLVPRAFSEADGSERWSVRTECLVRPDAAAELHVRARCLQVQHRFVEVLDGRGAFVRADQLEVDGQRYVAWDEALDRVVDLPQQRLEQLVESGYEAAFGWTGGTDFEMLHSSEGAVAGRLARRREAVQGRATVTATEARGDGPMLKVTVTIANTTSWAGASERRESVMDRSLVAVHTMLAIDRGRFVSLLDPPDGACDAARSCKNDGAFPVLIGDDDIMLSSPIILYDHPEVAPESPGDLYDGTEIDEILALRVLTLTDEERSEARGTDPRAAAIIDRVDGLAPEIWDELHGAVRSLDMARPMSSTPPIEERPLTVPWWDPEADASFDPWETSVVIAGTEVGKGSRVRLHPTHRSDAQDLFLDSLTATVAGIFTDVDGAEHVAVSVDDAGSEELSWQGRYLFFHPDEVEPLPRQDAPG